MISGRNTIVVQKFRDAICLELATSGTIGPDSVRQRVAAMTIRAVPKTNREKFTPVATIPPKPNRGVRDGERMTASR